ncbi:Choline-sulfatase [hydrothermal vent metagenome]|uniref:Choline-sulfatase n=1 Tax=hydrothermal vent metagenome TaxID=652676 RepID=A0A3B1CNJ8_9ZZZZ
MVNKSFTVMRLIKYSAGAIASILLLWSLFFLAFVLPNPARLPDPLNVIDGVKPSGKRKLEMKKNFIFELEKAGASVPNLGKGRGLLKNLDFFADYPFYKRKRFSKIAVSMTQGKYGMYLEQRNALYLPTPAIIRFNFDVRADTKLTFGASILGYLEGEEQAPATFTATIENRAGETLETVTRTLKPEPEFYWNEYDTFYHVFLRFLWLQYGWYNGKWYDYEIDLDKYAGQNVNIKFETKSADESLSHVFISTPQVWGVAWDDRPNVVLAVIDTLRGDFVGANNGGAVGITPNIDKLADEGVSFTNVRSQGNWSRGSFTSMLTGTPPSSLGFSSRWNFGRPEKKLFYKRGIPTIASQFLMNGYKTAIIGNNPFIYDGSELGVHLGFDEAIDIQRAPHNTILTTTEAIRMLKKYADRRFFMLFTLNTPHGPFKPPLKYFWQGFKWDDNAKKGPLSVLYRGTVAYADAYMAKFFEALDRLGLSENTIVIVTADHGASFFRKEAVRQDPLSDYLWLTGRHGHSLYEEEVRVPMIIRYPGKIPRGKVIDRPIALLDLAPTLDELVGMDMKPDWAGVSFASEAMGKGSAPENHAQRVIPAEGELVWSITTTSGLKYIRRGLDLARSRRPGEAKSRSNREELYDLDDDPHERNDLSQSNPQLTTKMRKLFSGKYPRHVQVYKMITRGVDKYKDITIEVISKGGFVFFDVVPATGNPNLKVEADKRLFDKITVTLGGISSNVRIYFETKPFEGPVTIRVTDGEGKILPRGAVHIGPFALAAKGETVTIGAGGDDFEYGDPESLIDGKATRDGVYIVTIPFTKWRDNVSEGMRLDPELETMMKRWGYM